MADRNYEEIADALREQKRLKEVLYAEMERLVPGVTTMPLTDGMSQIVEVVIGLIAEQDDELGTLRVELAAANALNAELLSILREAESDEWACRQGNGNFPERMEPTEWVAKAVAALAKSPAQSLADLKARVRREALEEAIVKLKPFEIYRDGWYGDGHRDAVNTLRDLISAQPAPARKDSNEPA